MAEPDWQFPPSEVYDHDPIDSADWLAAIVDAGGTKFVDRDMSPVAPVTANG
jgi:hypothetical protein